MGKPGKMPKMGQFSRIVGLLGLCALVTGCTGGLGIHRHEPTPPANASAQYPLAGGVHRPTIVDRASFEAANPSGVVQTSANLKVSEPEVIPPPAGTGVEPPNQLPGQVTLLPPPGGGAPITVSAKDTDIRDVLSTIRETANVSIVVSPGVSGKITLDLREKPLDEVLGILEKSCHLAIRRESGVIFVSTPDEVHLAEQDNLPIRVYHLNYVKASDVMKLIQSLVSKDGKLTSTPDAQKADLSASASAGTGSSGGGGGGSGGSDAPAGGDTVIAQDYEDRLKAIDKVIAQLDVPPPQVVIDAIIVQVTLIKGMDLGASLALVDKAGKTLTQFGPGDALNAAAGFPPSSVITTAGKVAGGFANASNGLKFGFVGDDATGFVHALESMSQTTVLAAPRITVLNKQQASIHLGDTLGYKNDVTTQTSTSQNVQFVNIGTQLVLQPFIHSDGTIRLGLHPSRTTGHIDDAGIPQTSGTDVTTNVTVRDGQTMVIGGLIDNEVNKSWDGLPFLSRLPWIGYLFRHTVDGTTKKELVVILTAHIQQRQCPEAINYLGNPNTLGLAPRVSQRPIPEALDGPNLLQLIKPPACPQGDLSPNERGAVP